jgi:hypothetical protein
VSRDAGSVMLGTRYEYIGWFDESADQPRATR